MNRASINHKGSSHLSPFQPRLFSYSILLLLIITYTHTCHSPLSMVSLLSFFTGKRKSRRAPSPPASAPPTANARSSSPARTKPAGRFLSLRQKSTPGRPADISTRRAGTEVKVQRKRSGAKKKNSNSDLPRLALGWEADSTPTATLGLEGVGQPPRLTEEEKEVVLNRQWDEPEMISALQVFGKAIKDIGRSKRWAQYPCNVIYDRRIGQELTFRLGHSRYSTSPNSGM